MAKKGIARNRRKLVLKFGLVCQGCKLDFPNDKLTVDHIRPLAKGGHPRALGNLQLLCEPCNLDKGDSWDGVSGLGIEDCNRKRMTVPQQATRCLQLACDAVADAGPDASLPDLVVIGVAAAIGSIPNGYATHPELAAEIRTYWSGQRSLRKCNR